MTGSPSGTLRSGKGTALELGHFANRDFNKLGTHRHIAEIMNQRVKQDSPSGTDSNLIFRATPFLVS